MRAGLGARDRAGWARAGCRRSWRRRAGAGGGHVRDCAQGAAREGCSYICQLLSSPSDVVREQAVWALGNVAGDSPMCRDLVLSSGALLPLLMQLNEHAKLSMLRNATWTLSNFCRGKPQPAFDQIKPALPAWECLIHSSDEEVLTDACWALSYLSDGTNDKIHAVIEAGVCPRLVELLLHPSPSVLIPALHTVGNIITGSTDSTIKQWRGRTCLHTFIGHSDTVRALAVKPGVGILSASHDCSIKLWALTGQTLQNMIGHDSLVYSVDSHSSGLVASERSAAVWHLKLKIRSMTRGYKQLIPERRFLKAKVQKYKT